MIFLFIIIYCILGLSVGQKKQENNLNYPECGKRNVPIVNLDVGVYSSEAGNFPWHVAIYKYNEPTKSYENICGGTIISPNFILSAAYCVYDARNKTTFAPALFKVVAGKISFEWTTPDLNAQIVNVNEILIHNSYLDETRSYEDNIALLRLGKDLVFNDLVASVCLPRVWRTENTTNRILQTAGWGFKDAERYSDTLKEANLEYINIVECRKKYISTKYLSFINYDTLCVLTPEGRTDYDTGAGLVQKIGDRYYLIAILSASINHEFSPSTIITRHFGWLYRTMSSSNFQERINFKEEEYADDTNKINSDATSLTRITRQISEPKEKCILPMGPGIVSYTKLDCYWACIVKPGTSIESTEIVRINCDLGYGPPSNVQYNAKYICNKGQWFDKDPECIKLCPILKQENVKLQCIYAGEPITCGNFMRPGTKVKFRCDEFYEASYDTLSYSDSTRCLTGGTWSDRLPTCSLECGLVNQINKVEATLLYGNKTTYGEYPWHVAIFIYDFDSNRYEYICGGSLIAENFVLTAAHCMFNPASFIKFKEKDLKVAAGKGKRDYYFQERYQVNSDVMSIMVPETYVGGGTRYAEDIALLQTEISFKFNHFVLPVCIDRFRVVKFHEDIKGTIIGWGLNENGSLNEELKQVQLPIMPVVECRIRFKDFIQFLTSDKYCVIHRNGSGTGMGDSGGGMTFEVGGQHYIRGIVSVKKSDSNEFSVFTNVSNYISWIYETVRYRRVSTTVNKICEDWKKSLVCNKKEIMILRPPPNAGYVAKKFFGERMGKAPPRIYTYSALVGFGETDDSTDSIRWLHGGALISDRWVLTTARASIDEGGTPAKWVKLGDLDINSTSDDARPQLKRIIEIIIHPNYTNFDNNNIALLKLDSPVVFDEYVAPICLHTSKQIPVQNATVTGWLRVGFTYSYKHLIVANHSLLNDTECSQFYKEVKSDQMICIAVAVEGLEICQAGAPLAITQDGGCTKALLGLSSFGRTCLFSQAPRVFTRVSNYVQWIKSNVWPNL